MQRSHLYVAKPLFMQTRCDLKPQLGQSNVSMVFGTFQTIGFFSSPDKWGSFFCCPFCSNHCSDHSLLWNHQILSGHSNDLPIFLLYNRRPRFLPPNANHSSAAAGAWRFGHRDIVGYAPRLCVSAAFALEIDACTHIKSSLRSVRLAAALAIIADAAVNHGAATLAYRTYSLVIASSVVVKVISHGFAPFFFNYKNLFDHAGRWNQQLRPSFVH